jgi:hypothetical protein
MKTYPFINRPIADAVLVHTQYEIEVKFGTDFYVVRYYSNGGSNRSWNELKNHIKLQAKWNGKFWKSVCSLDEFCQDWRLNNCMIFLKGDK